MSDHINFFMGNELVGSFQTSNLPTVDGSYNYEPIRGPGHANLHRELEKGKVPCCFYETGTQRVSFSVVACPTKGVLTLAGLEVAADLTAVMTAVDHVEVGRTAHQLAKDHGRNAYLYAAKLAGEAEAEGKADETEFWKAVSACLAPR